MSLTAWRSAPGFGLQSLDEVGQLHAAKVFTGTGTHRNRSCLFLAVTDHNTVSHHPHLAAEPGILLPKIFAPFKRRFVDA